MHKEYALPKFIRQLLSALSLNVPTLLNIYKFVLDFLNFAKDFEQNF